MRTITSALPSTAAKALDRAAAEVLALFDASPRPKYREVAARINQTFATPVTPDNLRVWLNRRNVDKFLLKTEPAHRHVLDEHFEGVAELRDEHYSWPQVVDYLKDIDLSLKVTQQSVRSWFFRRVKDAQEAAAAGVAAGHLGASRESLQLADQVVEVEVPVARASVVVDAPAPSTSSTPSDRAPAATSMDARASAQAAAQAELAARDGLDPLAVALRFAGVKEG